MFTQCGELLIVARFGQTRLCDTSHASYASDDETSGGCDTRGKHIYSAVYNSQVDFHKAESIFNSAAECTKPSERGFAPTPGNLARFISDSRSNYLCQMY